MRKFRLLMSKYGFSIIVMLLELFFIFWLFFYLGEINKDLWILVVTLLTVGTIFSIVNRSMTPESKVTWLLVTFIPVVGPLIYLMFGERRLSRKEMKQLRSMDSMKFREDNSYELRLDLKKKNKSAFGIVKSLLSMDHNADVYDGTASQYFALGEEMYAAILEDLKSAEKFIFLEYYIIEEGKMWNSILEILKEKAAQGVEIKLLTTRSEERRVGKECRSRWSPYH